MLFNIIHYIFSVYFSKSENLRKCFVCHNSDGILDLEEYSKEKENNEYSLIYYLVYFISIAISHHPSVKIMKIDPYMF